MTISANTAELVLESPTLADAIVDATGAALVVLDAGGKVVRWNGAAAAITGFPEQEMIGQSLAKTVLSEEEALRWNEEVSRIQEGSPPLIREYRWKLRDGSARVFGCSNSIICGGKTGGIAYVVCTVTNAASASVSAQIMRERTMERRDISRYLHSTISQNLVALSFSVSRLQAETRGAALAGSASHVMDLIDRCCRDVRVVSYMLAPPFTSESSLDALIESYADYLRDEVGLAIHLETVPMPEQVSPEVLSLLFAAVQEWTARAIRKSPQAQLAIRLGTARRAEGRDQIVLELESTPGALETGAGWAIFRERVQALGGRFEVEPCPARGLVRMTVSDWG
jgi:PAS domain S-box-containing protein